MSRLFEAIDTFIVFIFQCYSVHLLHLSCKFDMHVMCFVTTICGSLRQILDDPSPSPPKHNFSPEFCSFIDACLQKDPDARPTAEQVKKRHILLLYWWIFQALGNAI